MCRRRCKVPFLHWHGGDLVALNSRWVGLAQGQTQGQPNSLADVERLVKAYKSHRAADVFDKAFRHNA